MEKQKDFQKNFFNHAELTREEKVKWTKEFILCAHQELAEVLDSVDWKTYHNYAKEYNDEHLKTEIIDVLKFVMNLAIVWGMSAEDIEDEFNRKTDITISRFKSKQNGII